MRNSLQYVAYCLGNSLYILHRAGIEEVFVQDGSKLKKQKNVRHDCPSQDHFSLPDSFPLINVFKM
jgi:hypothetical protein